ncbi:hypothetical protein Syun_023204 [Stephania yunnanensis]|uniref:Uncharacterized protein n=1 Tax=Stephania yunnanensis TaxID=152371 RepID=A0AAP0FFY7_9MAGN
MVRQPQISFSITPSYQGRQLPITSWASSGSGLKGVVRDRTERGSLAQLNNVKCMHSDYGLDVIVHSPTSPDSYTQPDKPLDTESRGLLKLLYE